jgi:hypothetical protein
MSVYSTTPYGGTVTPEQSNKDNNKYINEFPTQTVSWSRKWGSGETATQWGKDNMNFFHTMWNADGWRRREKIINYRLVNGDFSFSEYGKDRISALVNFNINSLGEIPKDLVHYPICTLPLQEVWGEEIRRPFNMRAKGESEDNKNEYLRDKTELLQQYVVGNIQAKVAQKAKEKGIDIESEEGQQEVKAMTPPEIEIFMRRKYSTTVENSANIILNKESKANIVTEKFNKGWKDATVQAEEYYWVGTVNNKTILECVNPVNITFDKGEDIDYIDEAEWVVRGEYMGPSQVIDRYREYLTEKEIKNVTKLDVFNSSPKTQSSTIDYGSFSYLPMGANSDSFKYPLVTEGFENGRFDTVTEFINSSYNINGSTNSNRNREKILVIHAEWMSKRRICELTYTDAEGKPDKALLDGEFEFTKEMKDKGWTANYFWINEVWEGTKIGDTIYCKIQPKRNQHKSINKLYGAKLGYCGTIYNNRNATPASILDQMKPHQILYNIIANKLEEDFNTELGQVLLFDQTQIPDDSQKGWDFKSWLYYLKKFKIAMVNPYNEAGTVKGFNQFQELNLSLGNSIQVKIELLNYLEQKCWQMAGFSPQRLGDIGTGQTATATNVALDKSYNQTEPYFRIHNNLKARVLTNLLEEAKFNIAEGYEDTYFLDDMSVGFIKMDGKALSYADLCVYVNDGAKDQEAINTLKQLAPQALQNGASLYDVAQILTQDSIAVINEKLEELRDYQRQAAEAQQKVEQQKIEAENNRFERQLQHDAEQNQLDRESKIHEAELKALGNVGINNPDVNQNMIPDVVEESKLALEQIKMANEHVFKNKELKAQNDLKDKEIKNKLRIEDKKMEQIEVQNKSQEKMKEQDIKLKKEEMKMKEKEMAMKKVEMENKIKLEKIKIKVAQVKAKEAAKKAAKPKSK